jgi:polysaccharide biosynthesis/export protein
MMLRPEDTPMRAILCALLTILFSVGTSAQTQQPQQSQQSQQSQKPQAPRSDPGTTPPPSTQSPPRADAAARPELHQRYPRYKIGANDVMTLTFRYTPEFNQEVAVQPDGYIQLKGLPADVHAQGLTVVELTNNLQKAYSSILHDPVINIVLKDYDRPYFIAGGFVGKPGKYDLRGTTTASQAIAIAGGFAEGAKNSEVVLFRRYSDEWMETKVLNLKTVLKGKNLNEDTVLQPGDMLFVPKSTFAKIEKFLPRASMGTYFNNPIP